MSLDAARGHVIVSLRNGGKDEGLVRLATLWFEELKRWEAEETWGRAFDDGRMTMRVTKRDDSRDIPGFHGKANVGATSFPMRLDPNSYLSGKKNALGLHDVGAVLLKKGKPLSQQCFTKKDADLVAIFAPIPLEADMILFEELSCIGKADKNGALNAFIREKRASFTRLHYASPDDMLAAYSVAISDGKHHVSYGKATKIGDGKPVPPEILAERRYNAMHYKTKVAMAQMKDANNEVTVKYRRHAGAFPWFGNPDGEGGWIVGREGQIGVVSDAGVFRAQLAAPAARPASPPMGRPSSPLFRK